MKNKKNKNIKLAQKGLRGVPGARSRRLDANVRCRERNTRRLLKEGLSKEQIEELFTEQKLRTVLCLYYGSFSIEDGTKIIKIKGKEKEVPNILRGSKAAKHILDKYTFEKDGIESLVISSNYCWLKTDADHIDKVMEITKPIGRILITKHERPVEKKEKNKKPTNNTEEKKKAAKNNRKQINKKKNEMAPYYAALRKGGVSKRIKKHNKTLADKIENWLKNHKKEEKTPNKSKKARKEIKKLARLARAQAAKNKAMDKQSKAVEKASQKPKKPVQTKLNMAA